MIISFSSTDVTGPWDPAKPSAGSHSISFDQEVLVEEEMGKTTQI